MEQAVASKTGEEVKLEWGKKQHPGNKDLLRDCQLLGKQVQLTFTARKGT